MKILFTGMASSHCALTQNTDFFQALYDAMVGIADSVDIAEPKLSWTEDYLSEYDFVFFGMTPPTSLSANKLYGALNVLNLLYSSPKLRLIVDGAQVWQYKNSVTSFSSSPSQILSSFYSSRKDYKSVLDKHTKMVESVAKKMKTLEWPATYVPALPWNSRESLYGALDGLIPQEKLFPVQIDSLLLDREKVSINRGKFWSVDTPKSKWWKSLEKTLVLPGTPAVPRKRAKDVEIEEAIRSSIGLVIPPQERKVGTWWSYRYIQALNTNTPIVTHWQDSWVLDESWSVLAYQVEDMEPYERQDLAERQYRSYYNSVPSKDIVLKELLSSLLDSNQERTYA